MSSKGQTYRQIIFVAYIWVITSWYVLRDGRKYTFKQLLPKSVIFHDFSTKFVILSSFHKRCERRKKKYISLHGVFFLLHHVKSLIKIVAAFRGIHVSPAKHSYASGRRTDRRTDRQTDGRRTKWSLCVAMLCRRHKNAHKSRKVIKIKAGIWKKKLKPR